MGMSMDEPDLQVVCDNNLTGAMSETLRGESLSVLSDLTEVGLDLITDDGLVKDVPIVSTAISIYKIGNTLRERHFLSKFITFLTTIENDWRDDRFRKEYSSYFEGKNRDKEIEYLLIILDRLIETDEVKMLARLYERLLEGLTSFSELRIHAQIIERLLPGDYDTLVKGDVIRTTRATENESILRLIGLGLMIEAVGHPLAEQHEDGTLVIDPPGLVERVERLYRRTALGSRLIELAERDYLLQV